jgi:S-adenosylmethionine:tRNA ribosyltransferase-isomerase
VSPSLELAALDYELPPDRIAQAPLAERDAARLLVVGPGDALAHHHVRELPALLRPSLIVLNDTRVMPVRLFGRKPTGGGVELLLVERLGERGRVERWDAIGQASKGLREGTQVTLEGGLQATLGRPLDDGHLEVELRADDSVTEAIARVGLVPLPPYIRRAPDASDDERYQTVYARHDGSVAAPTAGLHFSEALLNALREAGHDIAFVTLHVGPGTFRKIRAQRLDEHTMHAERYAVPEATVAAVAKARADQRPVLAVGTTVVRTLEAACNEAGELHAGEGRTSLFIHPPYRFRVVDTMLTNFHLPRSSLLALVMAFGGVERVRAAYAAAIEAKYRFFSYGDAMLLRGPQP